MSVENNLGCFWFCFTSLSLWFVRKNSRHSLKQSDLKLKLITNWSTAFSRALDGLAGQTFSSHWLLKVFSRALDSLAGLTFSSHWLLKVFTFLLIGRYGYFGFGFTTRNQKAFYCPLCFSFLVCFATAPFTTSVISSLFLSRLRFLYSWKITKFSVTNCFYYSDKKKE